MMTTGADHFLEWLPFLTPHLTLFPLILPQPLPEILPKAGQEASRHKVAKPGNGSAIESGDIHSFSFVEGR